MGAVSLSLSICSGVNCHSKWVDQIKHKIGLPEIPFWRGLWLKRYYLYFALPT
jgi:hypothetical protein